MGTNGQFKKQMDTFDGGLRTAVDETACEVRFSSVRQPCHCVSSRSKVFQLVQPYHDYEECLLCLETTSKEIQNRNGLVCDLNIKHKWALYIFHDLTILNSVLPP